MLRVAGGCSAVKLYNRIRGDRIRGVQKVTLLTLLYLLCIRTYRSIFKGLTQVGPVKKKEASSKQPVGERLEARGDMWNPIMLKSSKH